MTNTATGLLTRDDKTTEFEVAHGAHIPCQYGRPKVTAVCGVELDWDDEDANAFEQGPCVVCLDLLRCPICGVSLVVPT